MKPPSAVTVCSPGPDRTEHRPVHRAESRGFPHGVAIDVGRSLDGWRDTDRFIGVMHGLEYNHYAYEI